MAVSPHRPLLESNATQLYDDLFAELRSRVEDGRRKVPVISDKRLLQGLAIAARIRARMPADDVALPNDKAVLGLLRLSEQQQGWNRGAAVAGWAYFLKPDDAASSYVDTMLDDLDLSNVFVAGESLATLPISADAAKTQAQRLAVAIRSPQTDERHRTQQVRALVTQPAFGDDSLQSVLQNTTGLVRASILGAMVAVESVEPSRWVSMVNTLSDIARPGVQGVTELPGISRARIAAQTLLDRVGAVTAGSTERDLSAIVVAERLRLVEFPGSPPTPRLAVMQSIVPDASDLDGSDLAIVATHARHVSRREPQFAQAAVDVLAAAGARAHLLDLAADRSWPELAGMAMRQLGENTEVVLGYADSEYPLQHRIEAVAAADSIISGIENTAEKTLGG